MHRPRPRSDRFNYRERNKGTHEIGNKTDAAARRRNAGAPGKSALEWNGEHRGDSRSAQAWPPDADSGVARRRPQSLGNKSPATGSPPAASTAIVRRAWVGGTRQVRSETESGNALVFETLFPHASHPPMRSRYRINAPAQCYFITSTIVSWLPVFTSAACCDVIVRSLSYCREYKSLRIYAWVILDRS